MKRDQEKNRNANANTNTNVNVNVNANINVNINANINVNANENKSRADWAEAGLVVRPRAYDSWAAIARAPCTTTSSPNRAGTISKRSASGGNT